MPTPDAGGSSPEDDDAAPDLLSTIDEAQSPQEAARFLAKNYEMLTGERLASLEADKDPLKGDGLFWIGTFLQEAREKDIVLMPSTQRLSNVDARDGVCDE